MPIYEYVCAKCGDHLEIIQKMDDKPLTRCAKCKGRLEKVVSKSSFAFKGSGWYVTDYAKSGSSTSDTAVKGESPAKAETAPKAETTTKKADPPTPAATTGGKSKSD